MQNTMGHARAVAIVFGIVGGIGLIALVAVLAYRVSKRKRMERGLEVRVEREIKSDFDHDEPTTRRKLGASLLRECKVQCDGCN